MRKFKGRGRKIEESDRKLLGRRRGGGQICDLQRKSKFQSQDGKFQQIVMTTEAKRPFHCALAGVD